MDLKSKEQISAFLSWVHETEGEETSEAASALIDELIAVQQFEVESRLSLVDEARKKAHPKALRGAIELSKEPINAAA